MVYPKAGCPRYVHDHNLDNLSLRAEAPSETGVAAEEGADGVSFNTDSPVCLILSAMPGAIRFNAPETIGFCNICIALATSCFDFPYCAINCSRPDRDCGSWEANCCAWSILPNHGLSLGSRAFAIAKMSIVFTLCFWLFWGGVGLLRQTSALYDLRQSGNLGRELCYPLFRRRRNDDDPGFYEFCVVVFRLCCGLIGDGLHLFVLFDGDADLPSARHIVRSIDVPVGIHPRPELILIRPLCLKVAKRISHRKSPRRRIPSTGAFVANGKCLVTPTLAFYSPKNFLISQLGGFFAPTGIIFLRSSMMNRFPHSMQCAV